MQQFKMKSALASLLLMSFSSLAGDLMVHDAWIRAMPPTSRVVPLYLTLHNGGDKELVLSSIASPRGEIALHQTVQEGEMMKMLPVDSIRIPAHGMVKLEPQGLHAMMSDFNAGVPEQGEEVSLQLTLADGETLQAKARVTQFGGKGQDSANADQGMHDHSMHH
ncbi:copper chaperone PCu(A)C [Shewanella cyperi]|nr:copper chaperone PCu(A)C [Shewanella cyperi]